MPPRGRKPKPTNLKLLEGNPGKRRLPKRGTRARLAAPAAPGWMDREAKAEWRRMVASLESTGILSPHHRGLLTGYCTAWSTYVTAQKQLQAEGVLREGYRGGEVKHPAAQVARDALRTMREIAVEFGMTPSSAVRVEGQRRGRPGRGETARVLTPVRKRDAPAS